jgi:hypothetical protein
VPHLKSQTTLPARSYLSDEAERESRLTAHQVALTIFDRTHSSQARHP